MNCSRCGFPDTRPGLLFKDGVCAACWNYDKRQLIDWGKRSDELRYICNSYRNGQPPDCLIPVSGGKDSHRLVHEMVKNYGMRPILATVTDSFTHTKAGTHNLRNLITKFNLNHWLYTISHDLFVRASRAAFENTGEVLKFVEYAIYTVPVKLAQKLGLGLVVFGEDSAYEYGTSWTPSPYANDGIAAMLRKIEEERPMWRSWGITDTEVDSILPAAGWQNDIKVICMSHFIPWSSLDNLEIARSYGFRTLENEWDRAGTIENFEQMDSVAYMFHLWMKYPKFGFQRVTDIATRRLRMGVMTKETCETAIANEDYKCDSWAWKDFADTCGYTDEEMRRIVRKWRNPNLKLNLEWLDHE